MKDEDELRGPHVFPPRTKKHNYIPCCDKCGHVPLNNRISILVTKAGCAYRNNAQYRQWVANGYRFPGEVHPRLGSE